VLLAYEKRKWADEPHQVMERAHIKGFRLATNHHRENMAPSVKSSPGQNAKVTQGREIRSRSRGGGKSEGRGERKRGSLSVWQEKVRSRNLLFSMYLGKKR